MAAFILSIKRSQGEQRGCNMSAQINKRIFLSLEFTIDWREEMSVPLFATNPILSFNKQLQSCSLQGNEYC